MVFIQYDLDKKNKNKTKHNVEQLMSNKVKINKGEQGDWKKEKKIQ